MRNHPPGRVSWRGRSLAVAALMCFSLATSAAPGQSTRPGKGFDPDKLYAAACKAPLVKAVLKTADGTELSEAQKKDIELSRTLMTAAEAALAEGKFDEAAGKSAEALQLRQSILGEKHPLTVSSRVFATEYLGWGRLPADRQVKLAAAMKQVAEAATLHEQGDDPAAIAAASSALAGLEATLPPDHVATCEALLQLGRAQLERPLLADSERSLNRALRIAEQSYGPSHPQTARVLDRLGWLGIHLAHQGGYDAKKMEAAASAMRRAQRIFEATYGEGRQSAEVLDNLGTALLYLRSPDRALNAKLRALYVREQTLGPEDKDTGVSFSNLAWLYGELGERGRVIPMRRRALAIFDKQLAAHHPYRIIEMGNLARDLQSTGKPAEAIEVWTSLIALDKNRGIEDTSDAIQRRISLGAAHLATKDVSGGLQIIAEALEPIKKLHAAGEREPAMSALDHISAALLQNRMYDDALAYQEQLDAWTDTSGDKNVTDAGTQRAIRLGLSYFQVGRLDDAKRVLTEGIARIEIASGKGAIEAVSPMLNLAFVLERLGEFDAAEALCEGIIQTIEKKIGRKTPGAAYALMQLGRLSAVRKRFVIAEFSLDEAKTIFDGLATPDQNGNIRIRHELANLWSLQGDRKKAEESLRSALALCREVQQSGDMPQLDGLIAETLHRMLDASDAAIKADRQAWRDELVTLLKRLEARRALTSEEKGWLAELQ